MENIISEKFLTNTPFSYLDSNASNLTSVADYHAQGNLPGEAYAVPVVFALFFFLGVIGNGTLILIVLRNREMRNTPNIFIVSLAFGDLVLLLVSVPFTSTYFTFDSWPYGLYICKVNVNCNK